MDKSKKIMVLVASIVVPLAFVIVCLKFNIMSGLSDEAVFALGILIGCIILWVSKALHEAITAIIMCVLFIALCGVPTSTVFSTFASSIWWLLLSAFTIGLAMQRSGLMKRMADKILGIFPNTFSMQAAGLIASGTLIGPFIPSLAAKVTLLGPLSMQIAEQMGYKLKSRAAEGLFLAMYTGARNVAPVIISASISGYALAATLPEDVRASFDLLSWFINMIPWFLTVSVLNYAAIVAIYKPSREVLRCKSKKKTERSGKAFRKNVASTPLSANEKKLTVMVAVCIIMWISEPVHHIQSHIVALCALVAIIASGVISMKEMKSDIAWDSLIFIGCVIGIAGVFSTLGIDEWIIERCYPVFNDLSGNLYALVGVLAIATLLLRFLIVSDVAFMNLFMVFLVPLALHAGINPWVIGVSIYAMSNPWFALYQNPIYLAAYYATEGRMVRQSEMAKYCLIYSAICLIGLFVSIPVWQASGISVYPLA